MGSQEGYNGKPGRIQGKDRKDTKEREEGHKWKTGGIQAEVMKCMYYYVCC